MTPEYRHVKEVDRGTRSGVMNLLKRCEAEFKMEARRAFNNIAKFYRTYVENAEDVNPVKALYNSYRFTVAVSGVTGAYVAYGLAHLATKPFKLPPWSRAFVTVGAGGLGAVMAVRAAQRIAGEEMIMRSLKYIPTTDWAPALACPPLSRFSDCITNPACKEAMRNNVIGGKDIIKAYHACRKRAPLWAPPEMVVVIVQEEAKFPPDDDEVFPEFKPGFVV